MLVVSDTTPLNYLVLIGSEHVLPVLYGSIFVPSQVIRELCHAKTPTRVRAWAEQPPDWVQVREGDVSMFPRLDPGEAAALALAVEIRANAILADDGEARSVATDLGLIPIGTLGVLAEAHNSSLLDFESAISALRQTNFHLHENVVESARKTLLFRADEKGS